MKFAVPRIWREPTNHISDCYFCLVNPRKRRAGKNAKKIQYPELPSTTAPVPHSEHFPVPSRSNLKEELPLSQDCSSSEGSEFLIKSVSVEPHLINSEEFNDLVRDLNLPKIKAEILASRLKQWNLLKQDVNISDQRKRHEIFSGFFTKKDGLCYCNDVKGLFDAIGIPCVSSEWRLFIDSSTKSLKAVLLHNGNKFPSLPLAHSAMLKENYESVKMVLQTLKYEEYAWPVIGDFKMVGFLVDVCSETNLRNAEIFKGVIFCKNCSHRIFEDLSSTRKKVRPKRNRNENRVIEMAQNITSSSEKSREDSSPQMNFIAKRSKSLCITDGSDTSGELPLSSFDSENSKQLKTQEEDSSKKFTSERCYEPRKDNVR
ncbi:unnamed protein product [Danaus chrysippus]|uniref:(African queen) hypothetical protein n=1 Tax=Danaus chrysippus TaxID=151541 RepID=A0A8J2WA56_9NEOP|nr:unnamed protein product [Danaus chrysippus]